jgi:hypothetical protein
VHVCVCVYVYVCGCVWVCICVCVCMCICICVCVCVGVVFGSLGCGVNHLCLFCREFLWSVALLPPCSLAVTPPLTTVMVSLQSVGLVLAPHVEGIWPSGQ